MIIELPKREKVKVLTKLITQIEFGKVFSGELLGVKGIFLCAKDGIFTLTDDNIGVANQFAFGSYFTSFGEHYVTNYVEMKATLKIEDM